MSSAERMQQEEAAQLGHEQAKAAGAEPVLLPTAVI